VTRDESQVSVGGMLALDQVLGKLRSTLTYFWTSTHWLMKERPGRAEIADLTDFED
jgi:hypothetical protein